jgi:hypothetical protein
MLRLPGETAIFSRSLPSPTDFSLLGLTEATSNADAPKTERGWSRIRPVYARTLIIDLLLQELPRRYSSRRRSKFPLYFRL